LSATIIIPRLGAASFIAYILIAQLLTSAVVDQFGLFGMARRPIDITKLVGLVVIVAGIAVLLPRIVTRSPSGTSSTSSTYCKSHVVLGKSATRYIEAARIVGRHPPAWASLFDKPMAQ
jgi:hypothetical protein